MAPRTQNAGGAHCSTQPTRKVEYVPLCPVRTHLMETTAFRKPAGAAQKTLDQQDLNSGVLSSPRGRLVMCASVRHVRSCSELPPPGSGGEVKVIEQRSGA